MLILSNLSSSLTLDILYFFCQYINHLVNQLARHQFLKIACQLEKKNMLGAYSLLKVIESELQAYLSATKGRVVWLLIFGCSSFCCCRCRNISMFSILSFLHNCSFSILCSFFIILLHCSSAFFSIFFSSSHFCLKLFDVLS